MSAPATPGTGPDLVLRLARLGAWLIAWERQNEALPDTGRAQKARLDYGLADLDPSGPGVILRPEVEANLFALIDPDDCHP